MDRYDDAAHKFYKSQGIGTLPLLSWDMYGIHFSEFCSCLNDIVLLNKLAKDNNWSYSNEFDTALFDQNRVIIVTDTKLTMVHATCNMISMNGYRPKEVLGKKPKMFQGPQTCAETTGRIRKAIANRLPFEETLINYRKNGSIYRCWIKAEPIFDISGKLVHFIAYEKEVA